VLGTWAAGAYFGALSASLSSCATARRYFSETTATNGHRSAAGSLQVRAMGGRLSRDEETGIAVESEQEVPLALPECITVTRRSFEAHMRGYAFKSWEELVRIQPGGMAPQGASLTSVKCDPMQVFGFIATVLLQFSIWGLVGYLSYQSAAVGIALTSAYGVALSFCIGMVPRQMAGMLWPNFPVVVGAVGLHAAALLGDFSDFAGAKVLFCVSIPSSAAAAFLMRKLPEDPDRAVLVTNLFAGLWSGTVALWWMLPGAYGTDDTWGWYWGSGSLVVFGAAAIGVAAALRASGGRWGSVELVTWTMNVGSLAVFLGTCCMLWGPTEDAAQRTYEPLYWLPFSAVSAALAALGLKFNRTFPVLLSASGLFAVCVRISIAAMGITDGSFVAGMCTFGALGIAVVVVAHRFLGRSDTPTSARDNMF